MKTAVTWQQSCLHRLGKLVACLQEQTNAGEHTGLAAGAVQSALAGAGEPLSFCFLCLMCFCHCHANRTITELPVRVCFGRYAEKRPGFLCTCHNFTLACAFVRCIEGIACAVQVIALLSRLNSSRADKGKPTLVKAQGTLNDMAHNGPTSPLNSRRCALRNLCDSNQH